MSSLADDEKKLLLEIARRALVAAVRGCELPADVTAKPALSRAAGAFVTLHKNSKLCGCIGQLPGRESLADVVAHCAASAALEDPRFSALRPDELPHVEIEISVLSALEDIQPRQIEPGTHGLVVSRGWRRAVLLPQVATQFNWSSERFLAETCEKAGLNPAEWKDPQTRIQAFTAEVFSEADLNNESARSLRP